MKKINIYIVLLVIFLVFINLNSIVNIVININDFHTLNDGLIKKQKAKNNDNSWKVNYEICNTNTEMVMGLISWKGNTSGSPVVNIKSTESNKSIQGSIKININNCFIDLSKSFCEQGDVDGINYDFISQGKILYNLSKSFTITQKGIYHLYLNDIYGNDYNAYFQIEIRYWKLKTRITQDSISIFEQLAWNLNVQYNLSFLTDLVEKWIKLSIFLNKYKYDALQAFIKSVEINGKGFKINAKLSKIKFRDFLEHSDYSNRNLNSSNKMAIEKINYKKLDNIISNAANDLLQNTLFKIENKINMHGYSRNQIITSDQLPKNKQEIDNYYCGESYSTWLQKTVNFKFYLWQLEIRITIQVSILLILIFIVTAILYLKHRKIYQPLIIKEYKLSKNEKKWLKNNKAILIIYQFVNLNYKKKKKTLLKKYNLNNFLFIQEIFKNNLDSINYKNYDNIFYNQQNKNYLSGKQFINIFLNCKNINEYFEKVITNYSQCLSKKFHKTIISDMLNFYFKKPKNSLVLIQEKNFDNKTKMHLAKVRSFINSHEWNYYFFELQNLMHITLIDFLNWKDKILNFMSYSKLLKRKLYYILQSEEKVEKYLAIIQKINFYRNLVCKVSPLKPDKFLEWNNLSENLKEELAWNIYNSLLEFIKFVKDYNDKNITIL